MSTSILATPAQRAYAQLSLRTFTVAALVANALLFLYEVVASGPDDINVPHVVLSLVLAGVVALPFRWPPALGALVGVAQLIEGYVFLGHMLTEPGSAAEFGFAATFFAISFVMLVAGVGALVQNYRAPRTRPFVAPRAPGWSFPSLLVLAALVLGGTLATAIQPRGVLPSFSSEAVAALPALAARDFQFDQRIIKVKAGEMVMLRLENADTATHHFDLDEFNVHALMPAGKSNVALFKPTQPGRYTFYCQPHANKETGEGMVGTLIVEP